jgi:putative salt-induced outer membrane protein
LAAYLAAVLVIGFGAIARPAHGQSVTAAPPPEAKAIAPAAQAPTKEPTIAAPKEGTTAALSAGGLITTGNSRLNAFSASGAFDYRTGNSGFGAAVLGNYGAGATPGKEMVTTTQNLQGRLRYDQYFIDQAGAFFIVTGRHDRMQGIAFRLNLDPGLKYLFLTGAHALWVEAGYDFQYDIRRDADRVVLDANKNPVLDPNGQPVLLDKTATDHSGRLFAGFRNAFNEQVTLSLGIEYLQSFVETTRNRVNFDALFAAKLWESLALGFGFSARYDHAPLPGKEKLDTSTSVSLIFAYTDIPPEAK